MPGGLAAKWWTTKLPRVTSTTSYLIYDNKSNKSNKNINTKTYVKNLKVEKKMRSIRECINSIVVDIRNSHRSIMNRTLADVEFA